MGAATVLPRTPPVALPAVGVSYVGPAAIAFHEFGYAAVRAISISGDVRKKIGFFPTHHVILLGHASPSFDLLILDSVSQRRHHRTATPATARMSAAPRAGSVATALATWPGSSVNQVTRDVMPVTLPDTQLIRQVFR